MVSITQAGAPLAPPAPLPVGRALRIAFLILVALLIPVAIAEAVSAVGTDPERPGIVDFHPFWLAGRLAWEGRFADGYDASLMRAMERALGGGRDAFMPFVYPPLFGLVVAPLALLPVGWAFGVFVVSTLAFYVAVLRRLAGSWFWPALMAMSPVILAEIRMGQNGFLTGGLAGLSALLALRGRSGAAGAAAGLLAFKPQMATMLPILFALRRDWRALATAVAVALGLSALAVVALGSGTVPAFLRSTAVVADFMSAGTFPLHRMTSLYAFALSLGAPAGLALVLHAAVALAVVGATATAMARLIGRAGSERPPSGARDAAGLALMATAFVSPYFFDYDLTVFGAGLALALPGLARGIGRRGIAALLIGFGAVGASGLVFALLVGFLPGARLSLGGPALLVCFAVAALTLWRGADAAGRAPGGAGSRIRSL